MTSYKHTQIGYLMIFITFFVLGLFSWVQITARAEPPSVNSGLNFAITALMALILLILVSFWTLVVTIDGKHMKIRFGWGIFRKSFSLNEIATVKKVKNRWYYGWGIRIWFLPRMWIFNVSGFDAVEIKMRSGIIYRIGTDEPEKLERAIRQGVHLARNFD